MLTVNKLIPQGQGLGRRAGPRRAQAAHGAQALSPKGAVNGAPCGLESTGTVPFD